MPEQRWFRVISVAFIMYTIAFIDRTNISLALPSMVRDLHLTPTEAGNATGVFSAQRSVGRQGTRQPGVGHR